MCGAKAMRAQTRLVQSQESRAFRGRSASLAFTLHTKWGEIVAERVFGQICQFVYFVYAIAAKVKMPDCLLRAFCPAAETLTRSCFCIHILVRSVVVYNDKLCAGLFPSRVSYAPVSRDG